MSKEFKSQKEIKKLSDEEVEAVAGGVSLPDVNSSSNSTIDVEFYENYEVLPTIGSV